MLIRRFFIFSMVAGLGRVRSALAAESAAVARERELHEKLLDTAALVRTGISFDRYSNVLYDLVVVYDRYERAGGTDLALKLAYDDFVGAKRAWEDLNQAKAERTLASESSPEMAALQREIVEQRRKRLQGYWETAEKHLDSYAKRQAEMASAPKKAKPAPSKKQSAGA